MSKKQSKRKVAGKGNGMLKNEEPGVVSASESKSEVARIREHIEQEYEAAERMRSGLAITARHAFITARMDTIGRYRKQLVPLVGEDEATRLMCESCAKAENRERGATC